MDVKDFINVLGAEFFTGVPDSLLRSLCDCLIEKYGINSKNHVVAANEGNAVAIAAGYHLATGKTPVVYMQNSGEGNIVNPVASLLSEEVYGIPVIFVIGWRGEPGVHDEPQHVFQGKITLQLLDVMNIDYVYIDKEKTIEDVKKVMDRFNKNLSVGKSVAFVVKKGALSYENKTNYSNKNALKREDAIRCILSAARNDPIVCTTGKASRELFELREARGEGHENDFLTVGSMGHCSSIALGIALQKPKTRIWCIDGDGAALMHMGAIAITGSMKPKNLIHILINNECHESVGGIPTVSGDINFSQVATSCGYEKVFSVESIDGLNVVLTEVCNSMETCFIELKCAIGSRKDLGRPSIPAKYNKKHFMKRLTDFYGSLKIANQ